MHLNRNHHILNKNSGKDNLNQAEINEKVILKMSREEQKYQDDEK